MATGTCLPRRRFSLFHAFFCLPIHVFFSEQDKISGGIKLALYSEKPHVLMVFNKMGWVKFTFIITFAPER